MKTYIFESNPKTEKLLREHLKDIQAEYISKPLNSENADRFTDAEIVSVFVKSELDRSVIEKLGNLKLIATRSTGFDHIDIDAATQAGIKVANAPTYGEYTVAEHTIALMLSVSRNIHESYMRALRGNFEIGELVGFELKGKTLGIVGTGSVGLHVINIAKGFAMKVLAYSRTKKEEMAKAMGYEYVDSFEDLLPQVDVLSFHVPLLDATRHMLNSENIFKLKKGAVVINTARGEVIDTDALYEALKRGHLGGAGLDVVEGEEEMFEDFQARYSTENQEMLRTIFENKEIFKMENVVFTPHTGFNSREAIERLHSVTADNIIRFLSGKPRNIVNSL